MADVETYLQHLAAERRLSPHSVMAARRDLAKLIQLVGSTPLADLTLTDIRGAIIKLRGHALAAPSVARHLSSWRGFYHFACRRLGYHHNPCVGLRPPKAAKRLPDTLTPDACAQLLDAATSDAAAPESNPVLEARDRAMFELLYSSGLRLAELVGLDVSGVDLVSGETEVIGKGRKTRRVPIGSQACAAITAWLPLRAPLARDTAALFVSQRGSRITPRSVQLRLDRWARRAGLDQHVYPHLLRHAFATHVLQSSGDLRAVQDMLGHASISTTQVYTHLDWQHLAQVYDTAHPRARKKPA
ncbi:MAG: tyrosine recombinase XerC [Thiobacillus sp.]